MKNVKTHRFLWKDFSCLRQILERTRIEICEWQLRKSLSEPQMPKHLWAELSLSLLRRPQIWRIMSFWVDSEIHFTNSKCFPHCCCIAHWQQASSVLSSLLFINCILKLHPYPESFETSMLLSHLYWFNFRTKKFNNMALQIIV